MISLLLMRYLKLSVNTFKVMLKIFAMMEHDVHVNNYCVFFMESKLYNVFLLPTYFFLETFLKLHVNLVLLKNLSKLSIWQLKTKTSPLWKAYGKSSQEILPRYRLMNFIFLFQLVDKDKLKKANMRAEAKAEQRGDEPVVRKKKPESSATATQV